MIINIADAVEYGKLQEKVHKLESVSGYSLDVLTQMFLAGFEMKLPENYIQKSEELINNLNKIGDEKHD